MFLEDIYITGICASHCSNIKRNSSSSFHPNELKYPFKKYKPELDALLHNVEKDQIHHGYRKLLIAMQEKMEKDNVDTESVDLRNERNRI